MFFDIPIILLAIICFFLPAWALIFASILGVLIADTILIPGQYVYYARFVPSGVLFLKTMLRTAELYRNPDTEILAAWKKWIPFVIFICITVSYADDPMTSIQRILSGIFILIGFPMALECYFQNEDDLHRFVIFLSAFFFLINLCMVFIFRSTTLGMSVDTNMGRLTGFFRNPNTTGLIAMISALICLYGARMASTPVTRKIFLFNVLLSVFLVLSSGSRASFLGLLVGMITYYSIYLRLGHKRINLLLILMTLGFVLMSISTLYFPEATDRLFSSDSSGRLTSWKIGWNMFLEDPVFGIGFGSSDNKMNLVSYMNHDMYFMGVHNSYLRLMIECGVIGLILALMPVFYTITREWRVILSVENIQLSAVMMSLVMAGLVNAVFEDWLFGFGSSSTVPFWLFFAILSVMSGFRKEDNLSAEDYI